MWADRLALAVLKHYSSLGLNGKPQAHEWGVLAAIVCENIGENAQNAGAFQEFRVLSLATGNKCVGANKMCGQGEVLNGVASNRVLVV